VPQKEPKAGPIFSIDVCEGLNPLSLLHLSGYTCRDMPARKKDTRKKTLGLISLGCPKNTVDSERLLGELARLGWEFVDEADEAECLIVNTCGFIEDAKLESFEAISEIVEAKQARPETIIIATGCLPQREGVDLKQAFPQLDLVLGVGDLGKLPSLIESIWSGKIDLIEEKENLCLPGRATLSQADSPRVLLTPPWTAYMKIAEGCDHACAFCTIPSIKGSHISRPVEDLVAEAKRLGSEGVRELILVSQDTTAYGSDIGTNLKSLLTELDKVEDISWIRLHYLYPSKISDGLLDLIAGSKRILPYFDIPLQHVKPRILSAMNRLAPDTDLIGLIGRIRKKFENSDKPACIRTTFIVGFPGETEEDIDAIFDFLEEAKIDRLTVFKFSSEGGTSAANLPEQVDESVADDRLYRIMEAQNEISFEINEGWVGKTIDVLLEGETDDGRLVGRSYRDAPEIDGLVLVAGVPDEIEMGEIVRAKVINALAYDLEAEWME
jgi:ribosomal protein S12 methylthiotransferase